MQRARARGRLAELHEPGEHRVEDVGVVARYRLARVRLLGAARLQQLQLDERVLVVVVGERQDDAHLVVHADVRDELLRGRRAAHGLQRLGARVQHRDAAQVALDPDTLDLLDSSFEKPTPVNIAKHGPTFRRVLEARRAEQQELLDGYRDRVVVRRGQLHRALEPARVVPYPVQDRLLRARRHLAPADESVVEPARLAPVRAVPALVHGLEQAEAEREHAHVLGDEVLPRVALVLHATVDELRVLLALPAGRRVDAPLGLAQDHLQREEHGTDHRVVVPHLAVDVTLAVGGQVGQPLVVDVSNSTCAQEAGDAYFCEWLGGRNRPDRTGQHVLGVDAA